MTACLGIGISYSRQDKSIRLFIPLLACALLTEGVSDLLTHERAHWVTDNYVYIPYHFYVLVEYSIISTYFARFWKGRPVAWVIRASTIVFCLASLILSLYVRGLNTLPSIQYNIEGVLNILLAVGTLYNLPVDEDVAIFRIPIFWICTALMIYHSSIFLLNGSYNFLRKNHHELAVSMIGAINYSLNYLYYTIISIAFLCSKSTKRSSLRPSSRLFS